MKKISERKDVQEPLANYLRSRIEGDVLLEVENKGLYIDILTSGQIIECKRWLTLRDMQTALGQLALYAESYPHHTKAIAVWDIRDISAAKRLASMGVQLYIVKDLQQGKSSDSYWAEQEPVVQVLLDTTANVFSRVRVDGGEFVPEPVCRSLLEPYLTSDQLFSILSSFATSEEQLQYRLQKELGMYVRDEIPAYVFSGLSLKSKNAKTLLKISEHNANLAHSVFMQGQAIFATRMRQWVAACLAKIVDKSWRDAVQKMVEANMVKSLVCCGADDAQILLLSGADPSKLNKLNG